MSEALVELLQHLVNGLSVGTIYALIALGYTMVYGVLKLINFAHGDVYMAGAFAGYYVAGALGAGERPSLPRAVAVTLAGYVPASVKPGEADTVVETAPAPDVGAFNVAKPGNDDVRVIVSPS